MADRKVLTLGEYLGRAEDLPGKVFQNGEYVYTVLDVWQEIKSRDIYARMECCDLEEHGAGDTSDFNLSKMFCLHDKEELIEGVNAHRASAASYCTSSI